MTEKQRAAMQQAEPYSIRELLTQAAAMAVAAERAGKYEGASWVADAVLEAASQPQQAEPVAFDWPRKACPCRDVQNGECLKLGCKWERDPSLVPEALRRQAGMQQWMEMSEEQRAAWRHYNRRNNIEAEEWEK